MSILEVQGLTKSFGGVAAVRGVSFTVEPGEMLALIGPNGAGKSTCFNMLGGQLPPDSGQVLLQGQNITFLPPRHICRLGVGRTFQITQIFASMSVRENVQTALLSHHRQSWKLWRAADTHHITEAEALLYKVGLATQAARPSAELAYGDLKRLELAIALAGQPRLLLMDEPTAGVAPAERAGLMDLVANLAREGQMAVLFTEHDMEIVFSCADRILVMDHGSLIAEGNATSIRANPQVQAVYLGTAA